MMKVKWGVLGAAKIALNKVIPAMNNSEHCEVYAVASQNKAKLKGYPFSEKLQIFDSYEELLQDPNVEAVYIPLPNHLHVPWSIKAINAGKHVLCEKPIGLSSHEAVKLLEVSQTHPTIKVMEAFMYRFHPQWQKTKQWVREGKIGELLTVHSHFSYHNTDPENVRNNPDIGGGGLMDIGCYCLSLARFLFGKEPRRVQGLLDYDPVFHVDRLASGVLDFETGTSTFSCATQMTPYQRVQVLGSAGRIEIEIPFNAPNDKPCRIWLQQDGEPQEITFPVTDQYTLQADTFNMAIINDTPVPTPLTDAVANMRVLEAVNESSQQGHWVIL
ncbi:gfo/Idh/MocA family oxidoreductase [candidate division KSB1 bacterium]|nr:gfo/Idh/MocA family oxidoreductase [candidate division KSB1 bacterium]